MVRSILLRGFDQQIANLIGDDMENTHGVRFIRSVRELDRLDRFLLPVALSNACSNLTHHPAVHPDVHLKARRRTPVRPLQERRD